MKEFIINKIAFTDTIEQTSTKQTIIAFGEDFSGKTRLGVTGPSVIGIAPLDKKTRPTAFKTKNEFNRRVLLPKDDLLKEATSMSVKAGWARPAEELSDSEIAKITEQTKKAYRSQANKVKDCIWALHEHPDVQIIVIDLMETLYNDITYAHYGRVGALIRKIAGGKTYRDNKEADQELVDFVNSLNKKHLVMLHRSKDEYVDDKATGRKMWSGYKHLGHVSNLIVEHVVNKQFDPTSGDSKKSWHYGLNVRKSLDNVELEGPDGQVTINGRVTESGGLRDEMITFGFLMQLVYPSSNEGDWV